MRLRRAMVAVGLMKPKPYRCRACGYEVPVIGSRQEQSEYAVDHWFALHGEGWGPIDG